MKIKGLGRATPKPREWYLNRDGIRFLLAPIVDWEEHNEFNPEPKVPTKTKPDGTTVQNETPEFLDRRGEWATRKGHYTIAKSIAATEDFRWDTVHWDDPTTWENYRDELLEFGLLDLEVAQIIQAAMQQWIVTGKLFAIV